MKSHSIRFRRHVIHPGAGIFRYLLAPLALGILFCLPASGEPSAKHIVRGVMADGACAIYGMSAEQSQLLALQKARAAAIEQAAGISVVSSTLVRDGMLAVDLIRTFSRGFIVREKVEWLPIAQYQDSPNRPPIPEYRVRIQADVAIPERLARPLGLSAKLNNKVFRKGEKARIEIETEREARIAIFNLTAEDRVVMLFPHPNEKENVSAAGKPLLFPPTGSQLQVIMQTLPGHKRDAEAFFVVAVGRDDNIDFSSRFNVLNPLSLSTFFERYAEIAPYANEVILPYIVEANE